MKSRCHICFEPLPESSACHERCARELFGAPAPPAIDVDLARLHTLALSMVGHTSLSGAQRKLSAKLSADRATLQLAIEGGSYILKPQAATFPHLPEIEWVTQRLAARAGIDVPPAGLLPLKDGSLAYVVRRFDRTELGKLAMEDFCQLAEQPPARKYGGSAELCGRLVRRYASQPLIESLRLFRVLVFNWCVGNGDLHLKNLALLTEPDGLHRLSPAYDQLATGLVIPGDPLALTVGGKRDNLRRSTWTRLGADFEIGSKAVERVLSEVAEALDGALEDLGAAPLPAEMRDAYRSIVARRVRTLRGGARRP